MSPFWGLRQLGAGRPVAHGSTLTLDGLENEKSMTWGLLSQFSLSYSALFFRDVVFKLWSREPARRN